MHSTLFPYIELDYSERFIPVALDKASDGFCRTIRVGLRTERT
jgi:hypothetical protein